MELDKKRRRSTEVSCNTSPDSGIGHGDPGDPPQGESPPVLEAGPPRTPSPQPPDPDGPFSPASPPTLSPLKYSAEERHFKKKYLHSSSSSSGSTGSKDKFRPKGKSWNWSRLSVEGESWWRENTESICVPNVTTVYLINAKDDAYNRVKHDY